MIRVIVCGGRRYFDYPTLCDALDKLHRERDIAVIIHGAARGADALAQRWAKERGIPYQPYPANWSELGLAAGPIRNRQMLKEGKPDVVVAFAGNVGTNDMVAIARAAGVEVIEVGRAPPIKDLLS